MLRYAHILARVAESAWAIEPAKGQAMLEFLAFKAAGGILTAEEIAANAAQQPRTPAPAAPGVAVLPLHGTISPRMNTLDAASGGASAERFERDFRAAVADNTIEGIVLDIDSPGGNVFGVEEAATAVFEARGSKRIVAHANPVMLSAAYWIGSQADELVMTPSGEVGSVGVYAYHEDLSALLEAKGVKPMLITAGEAKTDLHPAFPVTDEALAHRQSRVDAYYQRFVDAVARGRAASAEEVLERFGRGRSFGAVEAVARGMADRTGTLTDTIGRLAAEIREGRSPIAALSARRRRELSGRANTQLSKKASNCPIYAGARLAGLLNDLIDERTTDERSRADIIEDMAREAGISVGTVNQILRGEIDCPPRDRLEGFARALDVPVARLIAAAEEDGCDYGSDSASDPAASALMRRRRLALQ